MDTRGSIGTTVRIQKSDFGYLVVISGPGTGKTTPVRSPGLLKGEVGSYIVDQLPALSGKGTKSTKAIK